MNVAELVKVLSKLPADAKVRLHWDGGARSTADFAWLSKSGHVAIGQWDEPVYDEDDLAVDVATSEEGTQVDEMLGFKCELTQNQDAFEETLICHRLDATRPEA